MNHRAMAPQSQQQQQLGDASKKVKLLCSYGGRFHPRPNDAALRYAGGHTRIVSVPRDVAFQDFMRKMADAHGGAPAVVKYQLPGHDLDSLITVLCPDDLLNMMEEHDKLAAASASSAHDPKLRLFLFPSSDRGPEGDAAIGDSSAPATPEAPEIAVKPLAVVPAGMLVAPPSHTYAAEATKEMIPVPQVQYVTPQPSVVGAPVGLVAVAPPQAQYVPVVPLTTAPATPVPQETQYVPLAPAAPATQQPLVAPQPPLEASTCVERRLVHFPSDPSYAAARVGVGLPPAPPPAQAMLLDECAMCKRRLPHAHSEAVLRQEHGLGPTDEKMGLLSLQPETTMWSQVSPGTTPATCAADAGRYAQLAMPTAGYGFMEQATPPDAGGYAQFVTVQNVPAIDASGYTQMANVETAQRGLVIPGVGASSGEERLYPSGFTASPVLSEVPFSYFTQAAATGDALQQQGARQLPTHQYPIPQQFAVSKQENGNSLFSSAGEAHPQGSGSTPESTYNANLPVKGVVEIYAMPPDVSHAVEQWKEDAELSDKTIPDKFCSNDLAGEEEIFLGRNFGARGMLPEGRYMKKAWEPSSLEDDLLCDAPPQESRQLRSLLGDAGVCPPADVVAQSPSRYQLAQPQTNRDAGKVPVVRVNESDTDFQSAAVLGLSGTQKLEEIKDSSLVCSNPDPWKIMQDSNKLPPMPMKVAGQSLIPKHLLTENEKKDGGNTLPTFSSEEEDHRQLPGFLNKDSDSDMIQFMTGEKFKQDLQPVEKEVTSTHQVHENSTMVNKLQLEAQLTEGFGKLQIIRNQDLEELSELGSGTFGTVYHGKWRGSDVAIKRINDRCFIGKPSEQERQRSDFWNEACKLAELHHPNVVSFYGVVLDGPGGSVATVTEYMANGSLHGALQQKDKRVLDRRKRLLIAMDAAFGMEYLHKKNIVHFDLKSDNLLVNLKDPQRPICKVGDLGLSKVKCKTLISGGVRGTLPWMAPELLNGRSSLVSEKVDIYSFGIVMWELLTGEEPYEDMHYGAIIGGIINNTLRPPVPESCDPEWKCLMESCWASEPSQRPTFTEIVAKLRSMATFSPPKFKPQAECTSPTFSR